MSYGIKDAMESELTVASSDARGKFIYIACPWAPMGGGMYRIAEYLINAQKSDSDQAELRPLDTRGGGAAWTSGFVLIGALWKLLVGRLSGRLAGVHVNMAERLSLVRKGVVVFWCRLLGLPVALHLHAAQLHHFYRALPAPGRWAVRAIFHAATVCVVLGESARRFVVEELGVKADKVRIVINGVPAPVRSRRVPRQGEPCRLLFLGNLMERKGVSDLLHALARPEVMGGPWLAQFAGGGDKAHYDRLAQSLGLAGQVEFIGWADQARAAELLAAADVLILPSYDEGLPLVILEALAYGVAVICTPVGEIPHVLSDGVDARFVQPGDRAGLAAAVNDLVLDASMRRRMEEAGPRLYRQMFSIDVFFRAVADVHREFFGCHAEVRDERHA
jgi:glycosyltransferase involved in cell wall biosynthesis